MNAELPTLVGRSQEQINKLAQLAIDQFGGKVCHDPMTLRCVFCGVLSEHYTNPKGKRGVFFHEAYCPKRRYQDIMGITEPLEYYRK